MRPIHARQQYTRMLLGEKGRNREGTGGVSVSVRVLDSTSLIVPDTRAARCEGCAYPLRGLGQVGRCPECGTRFDLSPRLAPQERPHINEWRQFVHVWDRFGPGFRTIAIVLLLLGATAILITFGWIAVAKIEQELFSW